MEQSQRTRPDQLPADLAVGHRSWFGVPVAYRQWYDHALLPSGDLISTAEGMTHYLIAQLNEGRYNGTVVLLVLAVISVPVVVFLALLLGWAGA